MELSEELLARLRSEAGTWRSRLMLTATKEPRGNLANALTALREAPEWEGVLAHDDFALTIMSLRPPPWCSGTNSAWAPRTWADSDDLLACEWLQRQGISVQAGTASQAVLAAAKDAAFHPIRDYLGGLKWDGTKRLETFARKYLGTEATAYHATVGQCMFVGSVARIESPGCKVDHVPILEGAQGKRKSTAIEALYQPWFSDDLAELGTKDAAMQVRCAWGIEIAELSAMQRGEVERVKAFISRRVDRFRPSYGRHVIHAPRQSVFIGSTNAEDYLKDGTGGRRFWPLRCGELLSAP
jgi:predicted P-loop ATPase